MTIIWESILYKIKALFGYILMPSNPYVLGGIEVEI